MTVFRPLVERRTYRELLFLLSGAPLAAAWFGLLLAGWLAVGLLAVTPLVVPALVAFRWATWLAAAAEAAVARGLLGVDVRLSRPRPAGRGYWGRIRAGLADPTFWAQQLYLVLRTTLGFGIAVGLASVVGVSLQLVVLPVTYSHFHEDVLGLHVQTGGTAFALVPLGLVGVVASAWLVRGLAAMWARLARMLAEPFAASLPRTDVQGILRRLLPAHAAFYAGLNLILIVIWALTTRAYFWPEWTLMPLAVPLAIHAWTVFVDSGDPRRIARTRALAIDLGAAMTLFLFFVGIWAVTTRAYFWPMWPGLGLAVVVGLHALATMTRRIDVLTTTRAGAVESAESELRRIERDLHDGAQARLVAIGMSLGLAEQKLADDPEAARTLLAEARAGTGDALRDLRDLTRGIHPPILADRGLEPALAALVARVPLFVELRVDLAERPREPVESAAYFVAAEALANAAKHGGAARVDIRAVRIGDAVVVTIMDDGHGGANPAGAGLQGLRGRVEALDGTFRVDSPPGGPTIVEAVLPCAS
ncbi:MAG TPA: sensor domain-containing protein [Gaiellaceae bacterium]|nr:sensor domain-containing protein [Gaiellaceae bacterium]